MPLPVLRGNCIRLRHQEVERCAARRLDSGSRSKGEFRRKRLKQRYIIAHNKGDFVISYYWLAVQHITGQNHRQYVALGIQRLVLDARRHHKNGSGKYESENMLEVHD